jgi:hypothetical protein
MTAWKCPLVMKYSLPTLPGWTTESPVRNSPATSGREIS